MILSGIKISTYCFGRIFNVFQDCFEAQAPLETCAQRILKPADLLRKDQNYRHDVCCFDILIQDKLEEEWKSSGIKEFCCETFPENLPDFCPEQRLMSSSERIEKVECIIGTWGRATP